VDWLAWVGFGAVTALTGSRAHHFSDRPRTLALAARVAVLFVAVLGAWTGVSAFLANRDAAVARAAWSAERADIAVSAAESAVSRDSRRADYWNWLGLAREQAGSWADAAEAFATASQLAPHDSTFWSNLALSRARQAESGDQSGGGGSAAIAAARRAVEVDPTGWQPNEVLSEVAFVYRDYDLALRAAVTTIRLQGGNAKFERIAIDAALSSMNPVESRKQLEEAVSIKESAALHVTLAELALKLQDPDGARRHARRALEIDPRNRRAQQVLAALSQ
jgi:tetratricopeptide (TPR) repeat protein